MKLVYSIVAIVCISLGAFAQQGAYVKYEADIDATGEDGEMMAMMMNGSTMEVASGEEKTWVKTNMGTMMTMTMETNVKSKEVTMFMSGMMGNMAFQGNSDDLNEEDQDEPEGDLQFLKDTKVILGYKCKKAVMTDDEGNSGTYWYTEELKHPASMEQVPNQVPGLSLQFSTQTDGMTITYTAIEVEKDPDMSKFKVVIPDGVDVGTLEDLKKMGMGGK